jgi:hypothetical protein
MCGGSLLLKIYLLLNYVVVFCLWLVQKLCISNACWIQNLHQAQHVCCTSFFYDEYLFCSKRQVQLAMCGVSLLLKYLSAIPDVWFFCPHFQKVKITTAEPHLRFETSIKKPDVCCTSNTAYVFCSA